jgi:hypothetical protein
MRFLKLPYEKSLNHRKNLVKSYFYAMLFLNLVKFGVLKTYSIIK